MHRACHRLLGGLRSFAAASRVATQDKTTVALVLERLPVIVPLPEDWELEHDRWQEELQARHKRELPEWWANYDRGTGDDPGSRQWEPAPRVTQADRARDTKSLQRCLDQTLYFMVRSQDQQWMFPQRPHQAEETMRAAAERVLAEEGQGQGKLLAFFLGNGPAGHVWQEDKAVFYHRAQLIKGSLLLRSGSAQGSDFGWFSKPEVLEQTQQPELRHVLDGMLW